MRLVSRLLRSAIALLLLSTATPALANTYRIDAVSFTDSMNGVMTGGYVVNNGFISSTTDGGLTWSASPTEKWMTGVVADGAGGWAVPSYGSQLWGSGDGLGWQVDGSMSGSDVQPSDVAVLAGGRIVTVGRQSYGGESAFIKTSDNGGTSWTDRYRGPLYPAPDEFSPPPSTNAEMQAIDAAPGGSVAWAFGNEWKPSDPASYLRALAFKTTDGGSTWETQTLPPTTQPVLDVAVPNATTAVAVGLARVLYRTINDGSGWAGGAGVLPRDGRPGIGETNVDAYAVDALDANRILVGANAGRVGVSTNGTTFTYQTLPGATIIRDVEMLTDTHWIAVGDNETIYHTFNAGGSWTGTSGLKAPSVTVGALTSGAFPSGTAQDGAGVGVAGVHLAIRNGSGQYFNGSSWQVGETWVDATSLDGWKTWSYPSWTMPVGTGYSITARATDGFGRSGLASWPPSVAPVRVAATNRFSGSAAIARDAFDQEPSVAGTQWNVRNVVIASGEDRAAADPLSAAGLCGVLNAPLLLVSSTSVDSEVEKVIKEIAASTTDPVNVYIVGGLMSVPDARFTEIQTAVGSSGTLVKKRLATGGTRYDMAATIARTMRQIDGTAPTTVLVANGADPAKFFDALALSPISARQAYPILLVSANAVPSATQSVIDEFDPTRVIVGGGPNTVAPEVVTSLGAVRWSGSTRYSTAIAIADKAVAEAGMSRAHVGVAAVLPDALTGGSAVGMTGGVLVLTDGKSLTSETGTWLSTHKADITTCRVFGGPNSLSDTVKASIQTKLAP